MKRLLLIALVAITLCSFSQPQPYSGCCSTDTERIIQVQQFKDYMEYKVGVLIDDNSIVYSTYEYHQGVTFYCWGYLHAV